MKSWETIKPENLKQLVSDAVERVNVFLFTAKQNRAFEEKVAICARQQECPMITGPVFVEIRSFFQSKRKHRVLKDTAPDTDNLVKSVLDGLQGIAFENDKQVVRIVAEKWHCARDEQPRTEIILGTMG